MLTMKKVLLVPAAFLAVACGRGDSNRPDDALRNDLSLAAQQYPPQQFMSPMEQGYGYNPYVAQPYQMQRAPVYQQPVARRTSTVRRTSGTTGTVRREPQIIRNTKRDAAIGAAAGAIIGATTSRDKVKGAIIGAAAGGVLGGIIGHTVDVQKRY